MMMLLKLLSVFLKWKILRGIFGVYCFCLFVSKLFATGVTKPMVRTEVSKSQIRWLKWITHSVIKIFGDVREAREKKRKRDSQRGAVVRARRTEERGYRWGAKLFKEIITKPLNWILLIKWIFSPNTCQRLIFLIKSCWVPITPKEFLHWLFIYDVKIFYTFNKHKHIWSNHKKNKNNNNNNNKSRLDKSQTRNRKGMNKLQK